MASWKGRPATALYKGVQIDDGLAKLVGHMDSVEEYRENLQSLQSVWDSLALLGHLSGTGADMTETRSAFQSLTGKLLNQLGRETLKKAVQQMHSKAQVAVDIMVRNLFERTADIGFLAMDGEIRDYLQLAAGTGARGDAAAQAGLDEAGDRLRVRFREYGRKYSVYANVILLDPAGQVLLQMEQGDIPARTADPLVAEALSTSAPYVETFRKSDLLGSDAPGLIYSSRVTGAQGGAPLGVLCLCFRFDNEAERIFAKLGGADDWSVITLLDAQGQVIASSDPYHIPVGAVLPRALDSEWKVQRFAGREYLAVTRATQGYQGYAGPGWLGHVMLPLAHAFAHGEGQGAEEMKEEVLEAVTGNQRLFSQALREIPLQARRIQRGLNRSVWNGSVRQNGAQGAANPAFSKVLLWEISNTGFKTQDVFERSIGNLHRTVVSSILEDSRFRAALAIDIMDRNLYERANDCRWWALAPVFRALFADAAPREADVQRAGETLAHINSLYTVYDNLVLFDQGGRVMAVSNPRYSECIGQALDGEWVGKCLGLGDSQSYTVSAFAPTPLYAGRHTYIYAAGVLHPTHQRQAVGGIGIVFDAAPQFAAMLADALPRGENGEVPPGCFGVFADRQGRIIASTHADWPAGASLGLEERFFRLGNGEGFSEVVAFKGTYYAVGAAMSSGYREYKGEGDAYVNDVVALIFVPLGEKPAHGRRALPSAQGSRSRIAANGGHSHVAANAGHGGPAARGIEIATFHVDGHWFGIASQLVVEAIDVKSMTRAPGRGEEGVSFLMFRDQPIPVVGLGPALGSAGHALPAQESQIVVLQLAPDRLLGVMVDELGEIQDVADERIEKIAGILGGENALADGLVKPDEQREHAGMIMLLSPNLLRQRFLPASH